jgi:catechol 2,3-dioxygenase-like lactoylglutathione lyase family enzyme
MAQIITNLLTRDVDRSVAFYRALCGLREARRGDNYVVLGPSDGTASVVLIDWVSELVPRAARGVSEGNYLSVILDDVESALGVAAEFETEIIEETRSADGILVHAVVRDLDGRVIEISTPAEHLKLPPQKTVA